MTDCNAFRSGSFSMNSCPLQPESSMLATVSASHPGTRLGRRRAGAIAPRFCLKPQRAGRGSVAPAAFVWSVGEAQRAGCAGVTEGDRPGRLRQGDQSNFGAVPFSETASPQLVRCRYETSSKAAFPWSSKRSTDLHCCSTEETKKREFQRQSRISATYSSRGQESAGDRSTSSSMRAS